ncbi:MAG TPA: acyltransferase [Polyangiaceae bacterium]|nr:acyltransferase [Polyangiaceae bacterium]
MKSIPPRVDPKHLPLWRRALIAFETEFVGIHPRLHAYNLATSLLPRRTGGRLRANLLRGLGFKVGQGTEIRGPLKLSGARGIDDALQIGRDCSIDTDCLLEISAELRIGDRVTLEPGVMILTSTHELDFPQHRAGKIIVAPVTIGDGAWIRARAIVLPGVKIGAGAVVEAGAVVNKDVDEHTRVGGMPAAKLEVLRKPDEA